MKSVQALPIEKKARHLVALGNVSEMVAARLLVAYHLTHQRPMMGSFLDALGIAHEDGLIADEDLEAPPAEKLAEAAADARRVVSGRRRRALSVHADLAGPRDLGRAGRRPREPRAGALVARVDVRLAARCVWMDDQCRGVDRPRHADGPRDRPRHRQHRLHLDPGRQAAAEDRARARKIGLSLAMFIRIALLLSITWVMRLTTPLVRHVRQRDLRPRPDPARRRPVPDRQEHARDSRQAGRRGRPRQRARRRRRSSASSSRSCCSTSCSRSTR